MLSSANPRTKPIHAQFNETSVHKRAFRIKLSLIMAGKGLQAGCKTLLGGLKRIAARQAVSRKFALKKLEMGWKQAEKGPKVGWKWTKTLRCEKPHAGKRAGLNRARRGLRKVFKKSPKRGWKRTETYRKAKNRTRILFVKESSKMAGNGLKRIGSRLKTGFPSRGTQDTRATR